ncbi:unnamed protein product, partial [Notodromas monacha]
PSFKNLSEEALIKISDVLEECKYVQGEYIIRQGAVGDTFFIISQGTVQVTMRQPDGKEKIIRTLKQGEFFGEKALQGEDVRTANIIADKEGSTCLVLDRDTFNQLVSSLPDIRRQYVEESSKQRRIADQEFTSLKLSDLRILTTLGVGGFGRVELVQLAADSSKSFALKQMKKAQATIQLFGGSSVVVTLCQVCSNSARIPDPATRGTPPFTGSDTMRTYNIILKGIDAVEFPPRNITRQATALIKKLCRDNPGERLGYQRGGIKDIQKHKWFDGFNWEGLRALSLKPPMLPTIRSVTDSSNFDPYPPDTDGPPPDDLSGWDVDF